MQWTEFLATNQTCMYKTEGHMRPVSFVIPLVLELLGCLVFQELLGCLVFQDGVST
jgi:hypothetical protein